jgi:hypothetical protein
MNGRSQDAARQQILRIIQERLDLLENAVRGVPLDRAAVERAREELAAAVRAYLGSRGSAGRLEAPPVVPQSSGRLMSQTPQAPLAAQASEPSVPQPIEKPARGAPADEEKLKAKVRAAQVLNPSLYPSRAAAPQAAESVTDVQDDRVRIADSALTLMDQVLRSPQGADVQVLLGFVNHLRTILRPTGTASVPRSHSNTGLTPGGAGPRPPAAPVRPQ